MFNQNKTNWHMMLFYALWTYHTSAKTTTSFTPFQLIYGQEVVFSIESKISSLKLVIEHLPNTFIEEERLLHLHSLYETRREASLNVEAQKKIFKSLYDKVSPP